MRCSPACSISGRSTTAADRSGVRCGGAARRRASSVKRAAQRAPWEKWAQVAATAVAMWLMAAPAALDYTGAAATSDRVVGPIAASVACMAIWPVLRSLRWVNVVLGAWLVAAPWLLGY